MYHCVRGSLHGGPQWPLPPLHSCLYSIPFEEGWILWLTSNKKNRTFKTLGYKWPQFSLLGHFISYSLLDPSFWGKPASMMSAALQTGSCAEEMRKACGSQCGTEALSPIAHEELSGLEGRSFHLMWALMWLRPWPTTSQQPPKRNWARSTQLNSPWIPGSRDSELTDAVVLNC